MSGKKRQIISHKTTFQASITTSTETNLSVD